jgi:hypothetical protein
MEEALGWLQLLDPIDARIVWMRANGERWKTVCGRIRLARSAANEHWLYALCAIAWRPNGWHLPRSRSKRHLITRTSKIRQPRAADLLTDLKSGYLLGANPRQQFLAQFSGIFVGTVVSVLTFAALVPNAQVVLLTLAPVLFPKYQKYLPSASAFGLAWVFHWYYGLLFFMGALVALLLEIRKPRLAEEFTLPMASGVVAGGSLMGVGLVFWANAGSILNKLFGG